jgi:hypothetical protein
MGERLQSMRFGLPGTILGRSLEAVLATSLVLMLPVQTFAGRFGE